MQASILSVVNILRRGGVMGYPVDYAIAILTWTVCSSVARRRLFTKSAAYWSKWPAAAAYGGVV